MPTLDRQTSAIEALRWSSGHSRDDAVALAMSGIANRRTFVVNLTDSPGDPEAASPDSKGQDFMDGDSRFVGLLGGQRGTTPTGESLPIEPLRPFGALATAAANVQRCVA